MVVDSTIDEDSKSVGHGHWQLQDGGEGKENKEIGVPSRGFLNKLVETPEHSQVISDLEHSYGQRRE